MVSRTIRLAVAGVVLVQASAYGKPTSETVRVVAGGPAQVNAVVAGAPPSATISIVPVPAKVGSYPAGTTIVGNELRSPAGGFRAWFEFRLSAWDPNQDNVPPASGFQLRIDATGFADADLPGDQPDLAPPVVPCSAGVCTAGVCVGGSSAGALCANSSQCSGNVACVAAFGEAWARCEFGTCKAAYMDRTGVRVDGWCVDQGCAACDFAECDTSTLDFRCVAISASPPVCSRSDNGTVVYGGTLVLDLPAGTPGTYTVNLRTDETFMWDTASPPNDIPTLAETGFVVSLLPCVNDSECDDSLFCNGPETCNLSTGACITGALPCTSPTPYCNEDTDMCFGCTGPPDCPDDSLSCTGTEFCNLTSGFCEQSGNPCLANQICDEDTDLCLDFGACCLEMGAVCLEATEPDCVDLPPNGAGGVFLGHKSTCPEQNAVVVPEGGGTVFVHVIGPPVDCPAPGPARAGEGCPPSGPYTDPWVSEESGGMCHNFGSPDTDPIPGGFFGSGSDAFTSTVCLRGVPLGLPQYGDADTLISRSADPFDRCDLPSGTSSTVNIEIVALSLEGTAPITVSYTAGPDEQWNVKVDLSPGGLLPGTPPSTLTSVKTHCNSGTYTSVLHVQPRFTFTKAGDPLQVRVLDTFMAGTAPVELRQDDPHPWVSDIDPFLGAMVDLCSDFHANISDNNPSLECDCNNNSLLDACEGMADCQPNGVPDPCDITGGTSVDLNHNTRPDECDPTRPVGSGSPDKNRYGGLSVPAAATAAAAPTALRIKLVELHNPVPPNAPPFSAPDFSPFEFGASCTDPGGCVRWVGPVSTYLESQDTPGIGSFRAARLQCTPLYRDWSSEGFFHITAAEIAPSSTIDVENVGASCMTMEDTCLDYSLSLRINSSRWGDVAAAFNPPSPTTQPDGLDVSAMVNKFKNLVGAASKIQTQLQPNLVELNADLNALDISLCVDAFKGMAYPFLGPCPCPSAIICNSTPCTSAAQCSGGTCVKTCNGGLNDTYPCINNMHCPGGACGSGSCRDACGRCTP